MDSFLQSNKWISPDSERLWKLAHKIEDRQLWAGYLSEQEHSIWRKALRRRDTWAAFLEGRGEPFETGESQDNTGEIVNGELKTDDNGEKIADPVTTAFRARVMLFEFAVRKLFPPKEGDDLMDFDIDDIVESSDKMAEVVAEKPKTRDIEEDDYDDDEDEPISSLPVPESSNQDADSSMDNIGITGYGHAKNRRHTSTAANQIISNRHILSHPRTRPSGYA